MSGRAQGGPLAVQIDTGVDLTHPDLQWNLWVNQAEKNGKGASFSNGFVNYRDDDGNGEMLVLLRMTMLLHQGLGLSCLVLSA